MARRATNLKIPSGGDDPALPAPARELMSALGVVRGKTETTIPNEVLDAMRAKRIRETAMSQAPSTPRLMHRDAGGVGVRKGHARWDAITIDALRALRERSPLVQAIHSARQAQVGRLAQKWDGKRGEVGWRVVHKDFTAHNAEPPQSIRRFIKTAEGLITNPSPQYCKTTAELFSCLEDDYLTINRPVMERLKSTMDRDYIIGLRPVDGGLIWPTLFFLQWWMAEHPRWYGSYSPGSLTDADALSIISTQLDQDLSTAEYCLVRDGIVEAVYAPGVMIVGPAKNRTDIKFAGWYPGKVESAAEVILSFMNAWVYNASFFTRGMMSEFILGVSGNISDKDLDAFADMLRNATRGLSGAWSPPMIPLPDGQEIKKIDLKANNKDMGFETWMSLQIALTCAVYRMDPSTINAKPWDGGQGSHMGAGGGREKEIALAKEEGLQSDMSHLVAMFLGPIVQEIHPDLRMKFEYGDFDPKVEADINTIRCKTSITRNEVRLSDGMRPLGFYLDEEEYESASEEDREKHDKNLWNMPSDPAFVTAMNQRDQLASMNAQGQPDGFGGQDQGKDGFGADKGSSGAPPFGALPGKGGAGPGGAGGPPPGQAAGAGAAMAPGGPRPPMAPPAGAPNPMAKGSRVTIVVRGDDPPEET